MLDNEINKSEKWMIIIIIPYNENPILKTHIINHDPQILNQLTKFLEYLILPTLTLMSTLQRHSLINQIHFFFSTNHKAPTETLEPNITY